MLFRILSNLFLTPILRKCHTMEYENSFIKINLIPMFSDNYGYIITDKKTKLSACIDPGDGNAIVGASNEMKIDLNYILCTHKHMDHVGGNIFIKQTYPNIEIIGTKYEEIPGITKPIGNNDTFNIGNLNIKVFHVPCHTVGHIAFYITDNTLLKEYNDEHHNIKQLETTNINNLEDHSPILFCGDTLFVGGCGKFFEGTAEEMLKNMDLFSTLPHNTKIFCAHEYTESNLKFLASIDPTICNPIYEEVKDKRKHGYPTIPSTIGKELKYNLFMRCREPYVQSLLNANDINPIETMAQLRNMKNTFK